MFIAVVYRLFFKGIQAEKKFIVYKIMLCFFFHSTHNKYLFISIFSIIEHYDILPLPVMHGFNLFYYFRQL